MSIEEKIQLIEKGTLEVIDTEELKEVLKKERGSLQLGSRFLRAAGNGMRNLGKGVTYHEKICRASVCPSGHGKNLRARIGGYRSVEGSKELRGISECLYGLCGSRHRA